MQERVILRDGGLQVTPNNPMQDAVRALLAGLGEDPDREGLERTPERVE